MKKNPKKLKVTELIDLLESKFESLSEGDKKLVKKWASALIAGVKKKIWHRNSTLEEIEEKLSEMIESKEKNLTYVI